MYNKSFKTKTHGENRSVHKVTHESISPSEGPLAWLDCMAIIHQQPTSLQLNALQRQQEEEGEEEEEEEQPNNKAKVDLQCLAACTISFNPCSQY